jgi:methyl-accepting chemotaxis protein
MLPTVNLHFSWKQKLSMVIAITLVGLVMVAGSALVGFNRVNASVQKQTDAAEYKQLYLTFANKLLIIESSAGDITQSSINSFMKNVELLVDSANNMQAKTKGLGYADLTAMASKLSGLSGDYFKMREKWLQNRETLGFTSEDGKLAEATKAAAGLTKVSFSMIDEQTSNITGTQKGYLATKSKGDEQKILDNLAALDKTVIEMGWETNVVGIAINKYRTAFEEVRQLVSKEVKIIDSMQPIFVELNNLITQQNKFLDDVVIDQVMADANSARQAAIKVMLIAAAMVGAVIFISLGSIARQLNIQLKHMQNFLKQVAEGDFSNQLTTSSNQNDEFTQLRTASNHMVHDISGVISRVVDGNHALMDIRAQLEKAVEQLAITSEEVEQKTQQSTVATQQISIAVNDVAKRSVDVSETAQAASKSTKTGGKVINDCVNSMGSIVKLIGDTHEEVVNLAQSSSKMLGIIDVINGLADQTNLLALNAAIESARAGEAGRGFSVVADEVRALAQKTVSATSSIGDIIKNFNDQSKRMGSLMEEGIKLASSGQDNANNAMSSFESIEDSIQRVAAEMDQVVVAVEEISYNTNDIATQIEHICAQGESTKKTRLTLEKHTHQLSSQAETLGQLTSRFKLSSN